MTKLYVDVEAYFDREAGVFPKCIVWENGIRYEIDRILDVRRAASQKVGGMGRRYTVRISCEDQDIYGRVRHLFYEEEGTPPRWFVEAR